MMMLCPKIPWIFNAQSKGYRISSDCKNSSLTLLLSISFQSPFHSHLYLLSKSSTPLIYAPPLCLPLAPLIMVLGHTLSSWWKKRIGF